ncbi:MAG: FtsQ-type POTRA domain-containing protein [Candidatus Doudnabacteria bacterium]|nr:FtsQ-type POTRA domain-containing protein [Candidatus Doudnabacteria bacterium]
MIFSKHRKKIEPGRRYGSISFRNKVKEAANYKRAFNPTSGFSLNILSGNSIRTKIYKGLGVTAVAVAIYYLMISPIFLVTDIEIKGNHQISSEQIRQLLGNTGDHRFFLIRKNNFLIMTEGRVNKLLTGSIPTIKNVSLHKSLPNHAVLEISEHTPGFAIESNGKYFLVDDEGVVVNQMEGPQKLLVAHDQLVENFVRGERLPNQKLAPFIISMSKMWGSKINVPIEVVKFPGKIGNDVQFVTVMGWSVLMDASRPGSVQLGNLAVILSKEVTPMQQLKLAYIDLRLDKKAYYCFKESPCQQQPGGLEAGTNTNAEQ